MPATFAGRLTGLLAKQRDNDAVEIPIAGTTRAEYEVARGFVHGNSAKLEGLQADGRRPHHLSFDNAPATMRAMKDLIYSGARASNQDLLGTHRQGEPRRRVYQTVAKLAGLLARRAALVQDNLRTAYPAASDVPLAQIKAEAADEETTQAVEDWHYWLKQGYEF